MNILEKYLKNNRKVEIELITEDKVIQTERTGFYKVTPEKYIIYKPQNKTKYKENQNVKILVYSDAGIFVFKTTIISLNSKLIEINKPENYKIVQRRELLRAELNIPFILNANGKRQRFNTKNISGSGFSFYCNDIIDKDENIEIQLNFRERKIISKIKIVEIRKNLKADLPKYRYSVKLLSLNKADENYIIKLCIVNNIQTINI